LSEQFGWSAPTPTMHFQAFRVRFNSEEGPQAFLLQSWHRGTSLSICQYNVGFPQFSWADGFCGFDRTPYAALIRL
jgi:hypothetical protein